MRLNPLTTLTFALAFLAAPVVASAACGDDINGERVACSCGDVVVSDTQLLAGDPVASERCASDGLFVRAADGASSITLDLNGLSLFGAGIGSGIRVIDGGSEGAIITGGVPGGEGQVSGFSVGLSARGRTLVQSVSNLRVDGNDTHGAVVDGVGVEVSNVTASGNGRDGLRIGGRGAVASGVATFNNGGNGVRARGRNTSVIGTSSNDAAGAAQLRGRDHSVDVEVVK